MNKFKHSIITFVIYLMLASASLSAFYFITLDPISNKTKDSLVLEFLNERVNAEPNNDVSLTDMYEDHEPLTVSVGDKENQRSFKKILQLKDLLDNKHYETELRNYSLVFKQKKIPEKSSNQIEPPKGAILLVTPPKVAEFELEIRHKQSLYEKIMKGLHLSK